MESRSEPYAFSGHVSGAGDHFRSQTELFWRDYASREIIALQWVSLIAVTALLLRRLSRFFRLWAKVRLIPGPPCSSFHGHSKLISRSNLTDLLSKSHAEYGPVVKLWLGPTQLMVSIKDPELIKEMLSKAQDKLPLTGRAFHLAFGSTSLFVSSYKEVQKRRNLMEAELNGKFLERENVIPETVVDCMMDRIQDIMSKQSADCKMVSQNLAFTIIGGTLFGDAFLAWSKATAYEELLKMIAQDACFWASYNVTPFWKQGFWRYQLLCSKLKSLTRDIIGHCRQNCKLFCQNDQNPPDETRSAGEEVAFNSPESSNITMPANLLLRGLDHHIYAREDPCGNMSSVMFHGYITTAGLISNMLARLASYPQIQDAIHSEIITSGKGSQGDQQNVNRMHLLLATVYESARLLPSGPLLQRCSLRHDLNLKTGLMIPAGAILVVPVQLVQMDNNSWGSDASQFNPYRFLSKAEKKSDVVQATSFAEDLVDVGQDSYVLNEPNENAAFLPFGSGTRACLGQKFAILGVATLFASLLEQYEIRLQPGLDSDPNQMMNNCAAQLLPSPKIIFVKRELNK